MNLAKMRGMLSITGTSVLLTPLLLAGLAAQTAPELQWHTDFAAARQLAAERHAPLFVSFRCER